MTATITPSTLKQTPLDTGPASVLPVPLDESRQPQRLTDPVGFDEAAFGAELDQVRERVLDSLGEKDAAYIRRVIKTQRSLELGGRAALIFAAFPPAMIAGAAMLGLSKILENMELGHNVMHGQWDWMNDEAIQSASWEWDNVCPSDQWKHSHNYMHHQWTNVDGVDLDVGYGILRIHPGQRWTVANLFQPAYFVLLATLFEYGVGAHDSEYDVQAQHRNPKGSPEWVAAKASFATKIRGFGTKVRRQVTKDYLLWPLLSLPFGLHGVLMAMAGAAAANLARNLWSFAVIFCGHFPDGATYFKPSDVENETRGGWYRRQVLGSVNFEGGPIMRVLSGNLCHQVEHHLFPDLPSNRYGEIAPTVREICERHGIAYNTGSFSSQFATVIRKVIRLSFPGGGVG